MVKLTRALFIALFSVIYINCDKAILFPTPWHPYLYNSLFSGTSLKQIYLKLFNELKMNTYSPRYKELLDLLKKYDSDDYLSEDEINSTNDQKKESINKNQIIPRTNLNYLLSLVMYIFQFEDFQQICRLVDLEYELVGNNKVVTMIQNVVYMASLSRKQFQRLRKEPNMESFDANEKICYLNKKYFPNEKNQDVTKIEINLIDFAKSLHYLESDTDDFLYKMNKTILINDSSAFNNLNLKDKLSYYKLLGYDFPILLNLWNAIDYLYNSNKENIELPRIGINFNVIQKYIMLYPDNTKKNFALLYQGNICEFILVIRGTDSTYEWLINMQAWWIPGRYNNSIIHYGYSMIVNSLINIVLNDIKKASNNSCESKTTILISGHSLGGAVSLILADHIKYENPNFEIISINFSSPTSINNLGTNIKGYNIIDIDDAIRHLPCKKSNNFHGWPRMEESIILPTGIGRDEIMPLNNEIVINGFIKGIKLNNINSLAINKSNYDLISKRSQSSNYDNSIKTPLGKLVSRIVKYTSLIPANSTRFINNNKELTRSSNIEIIEGLYNTLNNSDSLIMKIINSDLSIVHSDIFNCILSLGCRASPLSVFTWKCMR